jgi:hypothetical protein
MEERFFNMAKPRKIIDVGNFTVDLRNLEYMQKVENEKYSGIRYVFFSGAHQTNWYYYAYRRDEEYKKQIAEFKEYHEQTN